ASKSGCEVLLGDWEDESSHRRAALDAARERGHQWALILDTDEVISPELLESLKRIADGNVADRVRVTMETYWKSPDYAIRPRERLNPIVLVNLNVIEHHHIREYTGGRELVLSEDFGILHHLSYAGPDERILRKLTTWSHRDEVVPNWFHQIWQAWDRNRQLRDLQPTHPFAYGMTERVVPPAYVGEATPIEAWPKPDHWPSVSVVVPLYGGPEDLRLCLQSLQKCQDLLTEVIIVDDASPDQAAEVAAEFPEFTLIRHPENRGFAQACNTGLEASKGEIVLFLNSDTVVPRAGHYRLIEGFGQSGTIGAVGPLSNEVGYFQRTPHSYSSLETMPLFAEDVATGPGEDVETDMLVGFCLAVRRSVLNEIGAWDTRFGQGLFEDNDLCYRIRRAGYRLKIIRRAFVHHKGSASLPRMATPAPVLLERNKTVYHSKWQDDLSTGFASHLSGQREDPIQFNESRRPEAIRKKCLERAKQTDISLCMIVRDEERVIRDCLGSSVPFFREVILVDTGSKDRTVEIATEMGATVRHFPWTESFSEARNESLRDAQGKWIFWMDADDTLPIATVELMQQAVLEVPDSVIAFIIPVQFVEGGAGAGTRVDHVKLFRNVGAKFEGRIHEQILHSLRSVRDGEIGRIGSPVLHSGYDSSPEGQAKKRARDEKLLKLDLAERPNHPFCLFNLGMTDHYNGNHTGAIGWLRRSISQATPGESHIRKAYTLLGSSLSALGRTEEARQTLLEGLASVGEDPDLRFQLGRVCTSLGAYGEAREHYLAIGPELPSHISSIDVGILGFRLWHNLGEVELALGNYIDARDYWKRSLEARPDMVESAFSWFGAAVRRENFIDARMALDAVLRGAGPVVEWCEATVHLESLRSGIDPRSTLHQLVQAFSGHAGPRLALARHLLNAGFDGQAFSLLGDLAGVGVAEAAFHLSTFWLSRGQHAEALKWAQRALDLNPGHVPTLERVGQLRTANEG
ncbi:MAG: glycosyltransferase, partial [Fimbriimonas sp.]